MVDKWSEALRRGEMLWERLWRLLSNRDGAVDAFELASHRLLQTLLVRPGAGAWQILATDGAELDFDRAAAGILTVALEDLRPLGAASRPPEKLEAEDLLFFVDSETLAVSSLTLTEADVGNGSGEDGHDAGTRRS